MRRIFFLLILNLFNISKAFLTVPDVVFPNTKNYSIENTLDQYNYTSQYFNNKWISKPTCLIYHIIN